MVQCVLKRVFFRGHIAFDLPEDSGTREAIKRELTKCRDKNNDYVLITLQRPKRPRTEKREDEDMTDDDRRRVYREADRKARQAMREAFEFNIEVGERAKRNLAILEEVEREEKKNGQQADQ